MTGPYYIECCLHLKTNGKALKVLSRREIPALCLLAFSSSPPLPSPPLLSPPLSWEAIVMGQVRVVLTSQWRRWKEVRLESYLGGIIRWWIGCEGEERSNKADTCVSGLCTWMKSDLFIVGNLECDQVWRRRSWICVWTCWFWGDFACRSFIYASGTGCLNLWTSCIEKQWRGEFIK